jgi:hypothetical protein
MAKFPSPYINTCTADDPMMHRVPMDETSIGSAKVSHPKKGVNSEGMNLKHVGGSYGKGE